MAMLCGQCLAKAALRLTKSYSECQDCSVTSAHGDRLCHNCALTTLRCQHCRSSRISHAPVATGDGTSAIPSDRDNTPNKMTRLAVLHLLFDEYSHLTPSKEMSRGEFARFVHDAGLSNTATQRAEVDVAFVAMAPMPFDRFVTAVHRVGERRRIGSVQALFDRHLTPLAARIDRDPDPVDVRPDPARRCMHDPGVVRDLGVNRAAFEHVFDRWTSSLDRRMNVDDFLRLMRRTRVIPERLSAYRIRRLFVAGADGSNDTLSFAGFEQLLCSVADRIMTGAAAAASTPFQLFQLLLLRFDRHVERMLITCPRAGSRVQLAEYDPLAAVWSNEALRVLHEVFNMLVRSTTATKPNAMTKTAFGQMVRNVNDVIRANSSPHATIDRQRAMLALAKVQQSSRRRVITVDVLAMTIAELADQLGVPLDRFALDFLRPLIARGQPGVPAAAADDVATVAVPDEVRRVMDDEALRIWSLYRFAATALSSPPRSGPLVTAADLSRLCLRFRIVPVLVTARQLLDAGRRSVSFDLQQFTEVLAAIARTAFADGEVLGRDCSSINDAERVRLLFLFINCEFRQPGVPAASRFLVPKSVAEVEQGAEALRRRAFVAQLSTDTHLLATRT